jgi:hypothetical protein
MRVEPFDIHKRFDPVIHRIKKGDEVVRLGRRNDPINLSPFHPGFLQDLQDGLSPPGAQKGNVINKPLARSEHNAGNGGGGRN